MPRLRITDFYSAAQVLLLVIFLSACSTVAFDEPKVASTAITDTGDTRFGKTLAKWTEENPGQSSFYSLVDGMDALGARLRLIEGAERSIDAQYFLMKDDDAGEVFAGGLLGASIYEARLMQ